MSKSAAAAANFLLSLFSCCSSEFLLLSVFCTVAESCFSLTLHFFFFPQVLPIPFHALPHCCDGIPPVGDISLDFAAGKAVPSPPALRPPPPATTYIFLLYLLVSPETQIVWEMCSPGHRYWHFIRANHVTCTPIGPSTFYTRGP